MFGRLTRLFELLQSFGGLASLGSLTTLVPVWFSELSALADAETSRDYHRVAIGLLRPLAPLTENDLDDGALIAAEALAQSDDWHAWVDGKLAMGDGLGDAPVFTLPEGTLAATYAVNDLDDLPGDLPADVQPFTLSTGVKLAAFLPQLLELIRELRKVAPLFKRAAAAA